MGHWEHLFVDGEFSLRSRLLSGLTPAQVAFRPAGMSHSIYEELWHAAKWQSIVVTRDAAAAERWVSGDRCFPEETAVTERMWREIVVEFMSGTEKAVGWGYSPGALASEVSPGGTLSEKLEKLAVHNAYDLGKIVALRQQIGAWPPAPQEEGPPG
jgi:hypothetical protein